MVEAHLEKNACLVRNSEIQSIMMEAEKLLETLHYLLLTKDNDFIFKGLVLKSIPMAHILIKDHVRKDVNTKFPSRLVLPAAEFTDNFLKIGHMAMNSMIDAKNVKYKSFIMK